MKPPVYYSLILIAVFWALPAQLFAQYEAPSQLGNATPSSYDKYISADFNNDLHDEVLGYGYAGWDLWENLDTAINYRISATYSQPYFIDIVSGHAVDIDADGLLDIVMAYNILRDSASGPQHRAPSVMGPGPPPPPPAWKHPQGVVAVHRNLGNLQFAPPKILSDSLGYLRSIALGELDGAPGLEIATVSNIANNTSPITGNYNVIYTSNYNSIPGKACILSQHTYNDTLPSQKICFFDSTRLASAIGIDDWDEDGISDVLLGPSPDTQLVWFRNNGGFDFSPIDSFQIAHERLLTMKLSDLDQDGRSDLVLSGIFTTVSGFYVDVAFRQGPEQFAPQTTIDTLLFGFYIPDLAFGDFNNDQRLDYIAPNNDIFVRYQQDNQSFADTLALLQSRLGYLDHAIPHRGDASDTPDLIQWSSNALWARWNISPGTPAPYELLAPDEFNFANALHRTDLNADQMPELLVGALQNPIVSAVHPEIGDTLFMKEILFSSALGSYSLLTGDWNGDGAEDVAWLSGNNSQAKLYVSLNNGTGLLLPPTIYPLSGSGSFRLNRTDFNADGFPDLMVNGLNTGNVLLFLNDSNGGFLSVQTVTANINSSANVLWLDWDGDPFPDAIETRSNRIMGYTNVLGMVLDSPDTLMPACYACSRWQLNDVNNDGRNDITFMSYSTTGNYLLALINGPDATSYVDTLLSHPFNSNTVYAFTDVNDDFIKDVIVVPGDSLKAYKYLLGAAENGQWLPTATFRTRPISVQCGDLNGDGREDIFGLCAYNYGVYWMYRTADTLITTLDFLPTAPWSVYPNPSVGTCRIQLQPGEAITAIELWEIDGRLVQKFPGNGSSEQQLSGLLGEGLYVLKVYHKHGVYSAKLILHAAKP